MNDKEFVMKQKILFNSFLEKMPAFISMKQATNYIFESEKDLLFELGAELYNRKILVYSTYGVDYAAATLIINLRSFVVYYYKTKHPIFLEFYLKFFTREYHNINGTPQTELIMYYKYKFIKEGYYIAACIRVPHNINDKNHFHQRMLFMIGEEVHSSVDCIHTAVMSCTYDKLPETTEEMKNRIISTEGHKELNLCLGEKLKAFRSYIQGIAEAGLESLNLLEGIQGSGYSNIHQAVEHFFYELNFSMEFMAEQLYKVWKQCRFENNLHKSSFYANCSRIFAHLFVDPKRLYNSQNYVGDITPIFEVMKEIDFPLDFFEKSSIFCFQDIKKDYLKYLEKKD